MDWSEKPFSLTRQCELLTLHKSGLYYQPKGESEENLRLMRKIDEQYLKTPFAGYRMMSDLLRRAGETVNEKRVRRLMRLMGLMAIYPKPDLSKASKAHKKYPYLLRNSVIDGVNQVWSSDITYIPMKNGFLYLVAVMDGPAHPDLPYDGILGPSIGGPVCKICAFLGTVQQYG